MTGYQTERYCPGATEDSVYEAMDRLRAGCTELSGTGVPITFLGGTFLPLDEAFSCRFEGTAQAVRAVHSRAAVPLDRLSEMLELQPSSKNGPKWLLMCALALVFSVLTACTSSSPRRPPSSTTATAPSTLIGAGTLPPAATPVGSSSAPPSPSADPSTPVVPALPELPAVSGPEFRPGTRTEELKMLIDRNGSSLQTAVDVFDLSITPMPGATATSLPPGRGFTITYALALIERVRPLLSPARLEVLDGFESAATAVARFDDSGKPVPVGVPLRGQGLRFDSRTVPPVYPPAMVQRYADAMEKALIDWKAYQPKLFAEIPGYTMAFTRRQLRVAGALAAMSTTPEKADPAVCEITVYPALYSAAQSDAVIAFVFAHELFHCVQFSWNRALEVPDWLVEGGAEFAARDLYREVPLPVAWDVPDWFTDTRTPLAASSYGAWALFDTFRTNYGSDPYPVMQKMVRTASDDTATVVSAGHLDNPAFASLWTSSSLRSTSFSDANWQLPWPNGDPGRGARDTGILGDLHGIGTFPVEGLKDFVHRQYLVPFTSDVGLVMVLPKGGPMLTHADSGTVGVGEGSRRWFCTDSGKCACPPGTEPDMDLVTVTPPMIFSFAASADGSSAAVTSTKWDPNKYCVTQHKKSNLRGSSNGDPHIRTFDGLAYDFTPVGEFVATRDLRGGLTVQERHQAAGFGTSISAVAVGIGHRRVTLTAHDLSSASVIVVRLDGEIVTGGPFEVDGVRVRKTAEEWSFTWPDGSEVTADWEGEFFLRVSLPPERAQRAVGLFGSGDGNFLNDLSLPSGRRAILGDAPVTGFDRAWLVDQASSLFDYEAGETTRTFRNAPPRRSAEPERADVDRCARALGEAATSDEVHSCAYDVTATGDQRFVDKYTSVTQQRVTALSAGATPGQVPSGTTAASHAPAGPGSAAASLAGVLGRTATADARTELTGSLRLEAGTVLLAHAACPEPTFEVDLVVSMAGGTGGGRVAVCGRSDGPDRYNPGPGDEIPPGEGYVLIRTAGEYELSLTTPSDNPAFVTVDFFADAAPTVVSADSFEANGFQGDVSGPADSILIWIRPGSAGGSWRVDGGGTVCAAEVYGPVITDTGPWSLGGVCRHHSVVGVGPSEQQIPLVIFGRIGGSVPVRVSRAP